MKNYDEMAQNVFARIKEYEIGQKNKKRLIKRVAMPVCCLCLAALLGIGLWQGDFFNTTPPKTANDAMYPGIKDTFDVSKGEAPNVNKIVINKFENLPSNRFDICLLKDDFVEMTVDEMKQYYGIDHIPDVPSDINSWPDEQHGIYKRNGGTGEIYWDSDILNYSNEDFSRNVNIEIAKGKYPLLDYLHFDSTEEKSVINNIEIVIGQTDSGYYYAQFMRKNIGFIITADGVSEQEFVSIITSLLD